MKDGDKTKGQLIDELVEMRQRIAGLEALELEHKNTEEKLREKEHMVDSTLSVTAACGLDGIMTYVNPSFLKVWGFASDGEVIGRHFSEFWVVKDRLDEILGALRSKESWTDEIKATKKDGTLFDVQILASTVYDGNGNVTGLMSSSVDIAERKEIERELKEYRNSLARQVKQQTEELRIANEQLKVELAERKRAEQPLRESEEQYRDLLDNANDLIQYVGPDGRIIFVNKKWLGALEYSEEEVKNLKVTDILHENQIARIMGLFKGLAKGGTVKHIETTFISKYGKEIYVEGNGSGVIKDGEFIGAIGIFRDITERKKMEKELEEEHRLFVSGPTVVFRWIAADGCPFCATGNQGYDRNLSAGEIIDQVLYYARWLQEYSGEVGNSSSQRTGHITNLVFMGMGEPLANYDALWLAIERLNSPQCFGLGARNMVISTAGLVPQIKRLSQEKLQVGLAISLHAGDNALRNRLVPINKRYPLEELLPACQEYFDRTGRRPSFEYVLFEGINDSIGHARALARLLAGLNCHVNLLPANCAVDRSFRPSAKGTILAFQKELKRWHITCTLRQRRGLDIDAGCGQLRSRFAISGKG